MVYLTKGLGSLCVECGAEGLERVALSRRSYHMLTSQKGNLRIDITLVAKCSRLTCFALTRTRHSHFKSVHVEWGMDEHRRGGHKPAFQIF